MPRGSVTTALYWDTGDPYHYIRLVTAIDADHDLLIVGGEDHKSGQADDIDAAASAARSAGRASVSR